MRMQCPQSWKMAAAVRWMLGEVSVGLACPDRLELECHLMEHCWLFVHLQPGLVVVVVVVVRTPYCALLD